LVARKGPRPAGVMLNAERGFLCHR
jgi:hypothetical protein